MEAQGIKYCNGGPSCIEDTCYQYISTRINNEPQYCAFVHLQIFKQYQYMTLKLQAKQTKITVAIHVLIFFSNFCSMRVRLIVKVFQ